MALAFLSLFLRCNYTVLGWVIGLLDLEKDNVHHAAKSNHVKPIVHVSVGQDVGALAIARRRREAVRTGGQSLRTHANSMLS